ncbi:hypothetical protein Pint_18733 [Pistacia integerrima]|uniref:Uncharacterized protein n=1 Tax=Pistacia integerrima TaxID=434235 RepID=A0ACC0Z160_9ROSI|nr:hypothetical protein Pint_18733 [Pistacia integerrima]
MMRPHYLSIIFFLTFIFNTQTSLCADDIRYTNCSLPVYCGDQSIEINYPFWGVNRPDYCGQPGFQIECQEGVPKINMMSNTFRILHINSTTQTLKVARDDFWSTICPAYLFNTTLDFTRFNYAPGQRNLTLYYGCAFRSDPGRGPYIVYPDCVVNDTSMDVFYAPQSAPVDPLIVRCNSSVIVPVLETAAQELDQRRNTINVTLDEGFELQWNLGSDQCNTCVNSGGLCGYNSTESPFVCFCRDQPNAIECSSSPGPPAAPLFAVQTWRILNILSGERVGPEYCGHPSYHLDCEGEVAEISIMERSYRVLLINNSSGTLTVAVEDYWNDICPSNLVNGGLCGFDTDTDEFTCYCPDKPYSLTCPSKDPGSDEQKLET